MGVNMGTAGYGDEHWSVGMSYGQAPVYTPATYDPNAAAGSRWNFSYAASTHERMYHSTVVLLLDGSLLISGSNVGVVGQVHGHGADCFATTPAQRRLHDRAVGHQVLGRALVPELVQLGPAAADQPARDHQLRELRSCAIASNGADPPTLQGGAYFNLTLANVTSESSAQSAKVVIIRGGFSTHALSMGQRYVELQTSYLVDTSSGSTTLYVNQLPPNPSLLAPGPAMMFLVVDGVPSEGVFVMIGNGQIGTQPTQAAVSLPASSVYVAPTTSSSSASSSSTGQSANAKSGAMSRASVSVALGGMTLLAAGMMVLA